jgi:hypothetical protein
MEITELNKFCQSSLIQTLDKRFDFSEQRRVSLKEESQKNSRRIVFAAICIVIFSLVPMQMENPRYVTAKVILAIITLILAFGILFYFRKFANFNKPRSLNEIQPFYGAVFLQTTDKYKTTPRDRNRSLKKAFNENRELFPYPLFNFYTKDGYKTYLNEWNEILRMYPLWKIEICAIRMMFTNYTIKNIKYIKIEIDYRMEEVLNTLTLYNALIEIGDIYYLVTPYPIIDTENMFKK